MLKCNIGAGHYLKSGWINIDKQSEWYSKTHTDETIFYDLFENTPLPIADNMCSLYYSSHVIEHVTDDAVVRLCKEIYRTLIAGGIVRFTAPDGMLALLAYEHNDTKFFDRFLNKQPKLAKHHLKLASPEQKVLWHIASNTSTVHKDGAPDRITDEVGCNRVWDCGSIKYEKRF